MAEIDSLGTSFYYAGVQNSQNQALKNQKAEKSQKAKGVKFSDLIGGKKTEETGEVNGLPAEIQTMSIDEAAIFLRDRVDNAGNVLSEEMTKENLENFKQAVGQFIRFVVENNFEVSARKPRRMQIVSPTSFFSNYSLPAHPKDPKVQVNIINEKLDALTRDMLSTQMNNLKILNQINEIKGLVVDLLRA